jgi:hypothetical protein
LQSFGGIKVSREDSMPEFGGESMQSTMKRGCIDVGNFLGRLTLRGPLHSVCCEDRRQTEQCHKEQLKKADTQHDGMKIDRSADTVERCVEMG